MRDLRTLLATFLPLLVLLAGQAAAQETLYGSSHQGNPGASTLHTIDPGSGAATVVGPVGFDNVGGMDFHPATSVLYAIARRPQPDGTDVLITIDPVGGAGTEVGPVVNTNPGVGHFDLTFRSDGTLFLTAFNSAFTDCTLFEVDLGSGLATEIGGMGVCGPGGAIGYDAADALFHCNFNGGGSLFTLNDTTGLATLSSLLTYPGFPPPQSGPNLNAMDFRPSTNVFYTSANDGTQGAGPNYLATLNTVTGEVTFVGITVNGLDALAWQQATPVPATSRRSVALLAAMFAVALAVVGALRSRRRMAA